MAYKLYQHWSEVNLEWFKLHWPDFTPEELSSREDHGGDGSFLLVPHALDSLQAVRTALRRALHINSAYRDPIHNAKVGGAPLSQHKFGTAFDISLRNHNVKELYEASKKAGFTGFGFYNTFLHVDKGPARTWGRINILRGEK